ncbi:hypothetical protein MBLNU459_g0446t1 [Dothideomycetes sp. NU459]
MSSLKAATAACLQDFALLFGQLQQHDELRDKLEEMQEENGRLKVWAGNLGALASGHSALDWRLRDSSVMRTSVLMLLRELQTLLQTSSDIVSGGAQSTNQDPDGTEFDFDSISLPSDEEGEGDTTNDLDDTFTSIIETVKNLYKLSFRIRNPNSRTKTSKASLYKEVSNDTGRDLFGDHFASFDRLHIVELLASFRNRALSELSANDEVLVSLLTRSNTTRRRQFRYWSKHGQKLATESQASDYSPAFVHDAHDKYLMTPLVNPGPLLHLAGPKAPSNIEKSIGTTTEATVFDPKLDLSNLETQSNISFATTAKDLDGRVAELPHPPSAATNGQDFLPGRAQDMQIAPAQFAAMTDILAEMREYCNQLVELIDRHAGDNTQPASGIQPQYISRQRVMENYQIDEWLSDVQGQGTALSALLTVIESGSSDVPDLPPGTAALAVSHQEVKDDSLLNESTSIGYDDRIVNLIRARLRKEMGNNNRSGRKGSTVRQVSALGRLIEDDPQLTERIVEHIADTVEDSSLLAKMILDYLVSLGTSRAITTALRDMPHTLNAIYEDSIQKHVMGSSLQNIGMKALAALSCAYREITMSELRHIIAFQVDHGSNSVYTTMGGNLGGDIIKSTRGLVIEDSRHMLKFFHPTFQNYMRNTTKWFPNAHAELACACLRYLGSERFAHSCGDRGYFNLEISSTLFATYAPLFWAKHIQDAASYEGVAQSVEEYMGNALKFTSGVQAAVWLGSETFDVVHGLDALHVCASLNLRHHTNRLIDQGARINIGEPTYSQTPLMYASRAGHHSLVCSLLDSGANVNLVSAKGKTALCEAIEHNHVEIVEEILRRPELDINSVRDTLHNLNALMVACDTGNLDIIQALLKHPKIDVNKLDSGGQSALVRVVNKGRECNYEVLELLLLSDRRIDTKWHDSQGRGLVTLAVLAEDYKMLETLLSHGTDGNSVDVRGRPAIYFAAEKGDLTAFSTLVAHGISARFENPLGQGLLHVAAAGGHPHMVLNMLSIGLNIDAQDFTGATSLHVTCRSDHRATAELLVKEKANTTLQDSWGRDAFTVARQYGHMWIMRLLKPESIMQSGDRLIMMTYEGLPAWSLLKLGLFQRFMEHFAKDPTWAIELEPYTNNTTMHWAVISGSSMVLDRLLIHPGLSPEAVNDQGRTPLHLAAVVDQPDLAFRLIKKLGQVSTKDFSGKTPLHCACEANSFRTAIILLEFGASVDVPDLPRSKLMFWALREKKLQAIKRLLPTDPYELYAEDENGKTIAEVAAECGLTEYVLTMMGL